MGVEVVEEADVGDTVVVRISGEVDTVDSREVTGITPVTVSKVVTTTLDMDNKPGMIILVMDNKVVMTTLVTAMAVVMITHNKVDMIKDTLMDTEIMVSKIA